MKISLTTAYRYFHGAFEFIGCIHLTTTTVLKYSKQYAGLCSLIYRDTNTFSMQNR